MYYFVIYFIFWFVAVFDCWFDCYVLVVSWCICVVALVGWIITVRWVWLFAVVLGIYVLLGWFRLVCYLLLLFPAWIAVGCCLRVVCWFG